MSFWGIEEDYEAAAEQAALDADVPSSNDANYEYTESAAEEPYRQQLEQQQLEQIATGAEASTEKKADTAATQVIKSGNTGMIIAIGAVAIGLFFLLKGRTRRNYATEPDRDFARMLAARRRRLARRRRWSKRRRSSRR